MTIAQPAIADRRSPRGAAIDPLFKAACFAAATALMAALAGIVASLAIGGWPAFSQFGFSFFTSSEWNPVTGVFGGLGPIVGTLVTALFALILSLPIAFGVAVFLVEFCPIILRRPIGIAVELLAGIPSIVYGMWGLFVFAPFFAAHIQLPISEMVTPGSIWDTLTSGVPNGANIFTASVILAIMILPYMAAVMRELFLTVPSQLRESGYGMGATTREVVTKITLPYVRRSAVGAVMLGLGRALGETMAVTFIIGNSHNLPKSLFDSGSTIASTIANEFSEASKMQGAALLALGFVLFVMTFGVLAIARALLGSENASGAPSGPFVWIGEQVETITAAFARATANFGPFKLGRGVLNVTRRARRLLAQVGMLIFCWVVTIIALIALGFILWSLATQGIGGLTIEALTTSNPTADGDSGTGGLFNAIVGSVIMCAVAMAFAGVFGVLAGTWLAEFGQNSLYARVVRYLNDILLSAPSILVGLFIYDMLVAPFHGYNALAGAVALAMIAAPIITRATEDVLKLQPPALRESGAALGAPQWTTVRAILWKAAGSGMLTGLLLAFARISGETAPLLFTAFGNPYLSWSLTGPMAALPLVIYSSANTAAPYLNALAWSGALVVAIAVLGANILARLLTRERQNP
ncbi:MAG TPA: phosphate ABC transporter permease subunit PstC [Caulobacteraceae bacterium]|nr:phosphate ABC transporter permease subunit PstC [Caulobacteraceae bacterium]